MLNDEQRRKPFMKLKTKNTFAAWNLKRINTQP
jgi:hypothetical protein